MPLPFPSLHEVAVDMIAAVDSGAPLEVLREHMHKLRVAAIVRPYMPDPRSASLVPASLREGIKAYAERRLRPGDFLYVVLQNKLKEAVYHADAHNIGALPAIVAYLHDTIPEVAWGSPERVREWLNGRYLEDIEITAKGEQGE